jgi:hypothetical protein
MPAQGITKPFTESYSDLSTEQAWKAAANAVQEMRMWHKQDMAKGKLEFGREFLGFPYNKGVRFKVAVSLTPDGKVQVTALPTKMAFTLYPSDAQVNSVAEDFFALPSREVGILWSQVKRTDGQLGPFGAFRKSLIGLSTVAGTMLPVWIEPNGDMDFPASHSQVKAGDAVTVTNLLLCERYPVGEVASECGTEAVGNRTVVAIFFNGAQPHLLPSRRPFQAGSAAAAFGDALDSLVCIYGSAISCVQANQRTNTRELERLQATVQQSGAETSWSMNELLKFQETGPEIVFGLSAEELSSRSDLSSVINKQLSRFVEISPSGVPHSTARGSGETTERPPEETGKLMISTIPENAEIFVDGALVGNSLATLKLSSGKHSVRIALPNYKEWTREVTVLPGSESKLTASLEKQE